MNQGYYRQPTIAGDLVVFVCEDDLWSVPASGGTARRLTASFGSCTLPRLSPDATLVAFVSNDEGNPEIYVMPARDVPGQHDGLDGRLERRRFRDLLRRQRRLVVRA
jgi:tricorn protease